MLERRGALAASRPRTSFRPRARSRTTAVRSLPLMAMLLAACTLCVAAEPPSQGREARGWLQLERDQETYRERVEPLTPREAATLETIERRQALELRDLQQRQRRSGQEAERRQRFSMPDSPPPVPRPGISVRESNRERLDLRIEQETLRGGQF